MSLKPLAWLGTALDEVRAFPDDARQRAGFELYRLQQGLDPVDWKPMNTVGPGVREIRIQTGRAFRILYVARFREAIYVLHAFEKKSQRTAKRDLDLAESRLAELLRRRNPER
ncbi:MAG TPA: type II toxin-antitoxin system RelE/ParE family toxin [Longimicrobiaceae bacterium]|nr:type II toxin-antitoxin system RelE/ParE family toxin [Longimicrobiaceae bacterium]